MLNGGAAPVQRDVDRIVNHPNYDAALIAQEWVENTFVKSQNFILDLENISFRSYENNLWYTQITSYLINNWNFQPQKNLSVCVIRVTQPFVWTANLQPIRVGNEFIGGGVSAVVSGEFDSLIDIKQS